MRVRIRRRRELTVALPGERTLAIAGGAALAVTAATLAAWRLRRPRVGDEAERWLGGG